MTKLCPYCREDIQPDATKCKHCGSDLTVPIGTTATNQSDFAKYIILAILLPVVGIIVGVVFMTKPNPAERKMGESIIAWSVLFMILWCIAWYLFFPSFLGQISWYNY